MEKINEGVSKCCHLHHMPQRACGCLLRDFSHVQPVAHSIFMKFHSVHRCSHRRQKNGRVSTPRAHLEGAVARKGRTGYPQHRFLVLRLLLCDPLVDSFENTRARSVHALVRNATLLSYQRSHAGLKHGGNAFEPAMSAAMITSNWARARTGIDPIDVGRELTRTFLRFLGLRVVGDSNDVPSSSPLPLTSAVKLTKSSSPT
eukprot:COSAG02_NODE_8423_length_2577_cov_2.005650_2_plen_202_part_00